jgi:hypothetical protein
MSKNTGLPYTRLDPPEDNDKQDQGGGQKKYRVLNDAQLEGIMDALRSVPSRNWVDFKDEMWELVGTIHHYQEELRTARQEILRVRQSLSEQIDMGLAAREENERLRAEIAWAAGITSPKGGSPVSLAEACVLLDTVSYELKAALEQPHLAPTSERGVRD